LKYAFLGSNTIVQKTLESRGISGKTAACKR
jgi:hypothetical protein